MSYAACVIESVNKFVISPLYGIIVNFREDDSFFFPTVGIEHLETDLSWMHQIRNINPELVENYENIRSEDALDHPFSFQTVNRDMLSQVMDKIYYFLLSSQMHFLNFIKMREKPAYRVEF